jgi:starch synthase
MQISGQPGIAPHLGKFFGIRNGIDADTWNPMDDPYLPIAYGPDDAVEVREGSVLIC